MLGGSVTDERAMGRDGSSSSSTSGTMQAGWLAAGAATAPAHVCHQDGPL